LDWFAEQLLEWHDRHGRKNLPWQHAITPYRVWVSEIMLQQTQVATVIDYYQRFMARFPTVEMLAASDLDDVLHHWTGLGYYARARNLHRAANVIANELGRFPSAQEDLEALPGIGRSTAGAIRAISFEQPAPILDGNVKRVLARYHNVAGYPGVSSVNKTLWTAATSHTPSTHARQYTQAIMDLGATVCTAKSPACDDCPLAPQCEGLAKGTVSELPTPKPKKVKPVQTARFFVVSTPDGAALVEQRPREGLWGGLWTPPQRSSDTATAAFLAELAIDHGDVAREHIAPVFRHTFSHYHLDIEPVYLFLDRLPGAVEDRADRRWVFPSELGENDPIGLSKPAVTLLQSLHEPFAT
jgi:A/G-specific adenine glycosylase